MTNQTPEALESDATDRKLEANEIHTYNYNRANVVDSTGSLRKMFLKIYSPVAQRIILILIILNSVVLGLETSPAVMSKAGSLLGIIDTFCVVVFCVELILKIISRQREFFKSGWNVVDLLVVVISVAPLSREISILRAIRLFRALRMITTFDKLKVLAEAILRTVPSVGWLIFLLIIIMYIFSVLTTNFYGAAFPETFGTIGHSMYTLFQFLTLDSWSSIVLRPMLVEFPHAYFVFIPYIIFTSLIILNVFVGVVVNVVGEVSSSVRLDSDEKKSEGDKAGQEAPKYNVPSHLRIFETEFKDLKDQLNRIEEMLKSERK
jgi:voltage-gated sodium channel